MQPQTNVCPESSLVSGYDQAGRVTISNNELDGETDWSASCNGDHYWTMLFLGAADKITFVNNYIHNTSGRSPKIGGSGDITFHAVNNYWSSIGGHAFDVATGGKVLIEGNVFDDVEIPITPGTANDGGVVFNVPSTAVSSCSSYLGRTCVTNSLSSSGDFASFSDVEALSGFSDETNIVEAKSTDGLADIIKTNAGIGKLIRSTDIKVTISSSTSTESSKAPIATTLVNVKTSAAVKPSSVEASISPAQTSESVSSGGTILEWQQCGGNNWSGSGTCAFGLTCKVWNDYYSQCILD